MTESKEKETKKKRKDIADVLCSPEQLEDRTDQCRGNEEKGIPRCDDFVDSGASERCRRCGCNLPFKRKVKAWECPLKKFKRL